MVHSSRVTWKRPAESNGTPAMDLGHMNVASNWCICMLAVVKNLGILIIIIVIIINMIFFRFDLFFRFSSFDFFWFRVYFWGVHYMCIWVEKDMLWGRCSVNIRML